MHRILAILFVCAAGTGAGADETLPPDVLMKSVDPVQREQAAAALGARNDTKAAKLLISMLDDSDWGVRLAATKAVAPIRFEPGTDALVRQLERGEILAIRHATAAALKAKDDAKTFARIARLAVRTKNPEYRRRYVEALGILGGPEAVDGLKKCLRSPQPEIRIAAAQALGALADPASESALIHAFRDKEDEVQWFVAIALARIDSDTARAACLDWIASGTARRPRPRYVLRRVARHGPAANAEKFREAIAQRVTDTRRADPFLEIAAYASVAEAAPAALGHRRSRNAATRAFAWKVAGLGDPLTWKDVTRGLKDKAAPVRYAATIAFLTGQKTPEARAAALDQVLRYGAGDVVLTGVRHAVETKATGALEALTALARGKTAAKREWEARAAACVALGRIGRSEAFAVLAELAEERQWWLRAAALEGAFHCWRKEAVPLFIDAFLDRHPVVRHTARTNLKYMTRLEYDSKASYEQWWDTVGKRTFNPMHPEDLKKLIEANRKRGYATPKDVQKLLAGTDILVIKGRWDFVEKILEDLEVRHTAVFAQKVKDRGLNSKEIVLVNCEGNVDSETTEFLRWFVVTGGYMATTDWALVNALSRTFPYVVERYAKQSTGNDVVVVEANEPGDPLLRNVFEPGVRPKWWLEIQAFPLKLADPVKSRVLIDSFQMLSRYGASSMLVEFPAGLGKVMHSASHFYLAKEGFAEVNDPKDRKIFAADHLGLSIEEIRELEATGFFENVNDTTPVSSSYSMFTLLVNFIEEKMKRDRSWK